MLRTFSTINIDATELTNFINLLRNEENSIANENFGSATCAFSNSPYHLRILSLIHRKG